MALNSLCYALTIRPTDRLATDLQNYPDKGVYCYAARGFVSSSLGCRLGTIFCILFKKFTILNVLNVTSRLFFVIDVVAPVSPFN